MEVDKSDEQSDSTVKGNLSKATMRAIVLIAIIEGVLLLVIHELLVRNWWPATSIPLRTLWYTLDIAIPTALCLLIKDARDRRLWLIMPIYAILLVPMAIYTGMQYVPAHGTLPGSIFVPYTLSQIVIWFIAMFFMSAWLEGSSFRRTTQDVCAFTWRHALALGLIAVYLLVLWGLLHLWGALFKILNIDFFETLFENRKFIYPVAGLAGGIAVVILRGQVDAVSMVERIASALLRVLFPILALIIIIFLIALLFTGVHPLWKTGMAATLMMSLIALTLLFANVVFSGNRRRYPGWLRWPIWTALALLPLYVILSAWAMGLRVSQYGLSLERLWAWVVLVIFAGFVLPYAVAVILRRDQWLEWLPAINKIVGAFAALFLVLTALPVLNLSRMSASSQINRLFIGKVTPEKFDYSYLRFRLGEAGYENLMDLQHSTFAISHNGMIARIQDALNAKYYLSPSLSTVPTTPAEIAAAFRSYPTGVKIQDGLLDVLARDKSLNYCFAKQDNCALIQVQLSEAGPAQFLIAHGNYYYDQLLVYAYQQGHWAKIGCICTGPRSSTSLVRALETGHYKIVSPIYSDIQVEGNHYSVTLYNLAEDGQK